MGYKHKEYMETPTASINITTNGTHDVTNYATAVVNAAKPEQAKTATPTTSQQTITPDDGYALSSVTVNAMPTGSMGTVSASKSISGNTATVTPSISAGTAGYNEHAAVSGTAVTVTAGEVTSGNINITNTSSTNVANYATAQVVDANLVAGNIKNGTSILGVSGTYTSDADAAASNILSGKTAYVNGSKITGSMTNRGAVTSSLNCSSNYTIPAGYHNGSGYVTANSLASQTSATASADKILSGYTAWVNGSKLTGTASSGATFTDITSSMIITGTANNITLRLPYVNGKAPVSFCVKVEDAENYDWYFLIPYANSTSVMCYGPNRGSARTWDRTEGSNYSQFSITNTSAWNTLTSGWTLDSCQGFYIT